METSTDAGSRSQPHLEPGSCSLRWQDEGMQWSALLLRSDPCKQPLCLLTV